MVEIRLHDTMARAKRAFVPADPARITMYVCGPTVYNRAHIGNARPAVVFDLLARLLRHLYGAGSLVYARNVTDVDDKIIDAARSEGVDPSVITERFERYYLEDMGALGVGAPDIAPRATDHVGEMIGMIARLIETGNAYEADGHVLFNVPSDPDYGALGRRDRDAMIAGARVEVASYKQDPADFVLWKPSDPDVIGWDSPWGRGRPGWHIECSAMIERHLGRTIDIHGGGLDLIFPHHENEIAQSRCAHDGAALARHWIHNGFLSMAGSEKMSKSLGNVVLVNELLAAGHKGETLRLALLSAHYRQPLEWSEGLVAQSKARLDRWYRALAVVEASELPVQRYSLSGFLEALSDDLNTPRAIAVLDGFLRVLDRPDPAAVYEEGQLAYGAGSGPSILAAAVESARLMGFLQMSSRDWFQGEGDARVEAAIYARAQAKQRRDFAEADRIRTELSAEGIVLEDGPEGTTWRRA
jgi:cysteinyl-tRNA synthetase